MKKILILFISLVGLTLMFSCEKDQVGPTLNLSEAVAPSIITPTDGGSLVLLPADADEVFKIKWSKADYKLSDLPSVKYSLTLTYPAGESFITLATTTADSAVIAYQKLNLDVLSFGLEPEEPGDFVIKVTASISDNSTSDNLQSATVSYTFTPYDAAPPVKNIYLLGNATLAGWNNLNALEMYWLQGAKYEIETTLTGGSGQYIKFISVLGKWAPQWGTDATGTWESGPLVYRPNETVSDPPAIPAPPTSGEYKVFADTVDLVYTVTPITKKLYLIGDATEAGTDLTKAITMNRVSSMKFQVTTNLKAGDNYSFGFVDQLQVDSWQYRVNELGKLTYVAPDSKASFISAPKEEGLYLIEVDIVTRNYSLTKL